MYCSFLPTNIELQTTILAKYRNTVVMTFNCQDTGRLMRIARAVDAFSPKGKGWHLEAGQTSQCQCWSVAVLASNDDSTEVLVLTSS